jgi:hypothetical protein
MTRCVACVTEAVEGSFCRACGAPLPAPWLRPATPVARVPAPTSPTEAPLLAASPAALVAVRAPGPWNDRCLSVVVAGAVAVLILAGIAAAALL